MGLDISAVNKKYGAEKKWYDARNNDEEIKKPDDVTDDEFEKKGYYYEYDDLETNETYECASIGYFGFHHLRNDLAKKYGIEDYRKWLDNFGTYFFREEDYGLVMSLEDSEQGDKKHPKFNDFITKITSLKEEDYFDLLPLFLHSDCDGEMCLKDVERIYPKIKEFLQPLIDSETKQYGYTGRDYEWFEQDFINTLEAVIKKKGKLLFS